MFTPEHRATTMVPNTHRISDTSTTTIVFGSFRVFPMERLLTEDGEAVRIGSRAFDILLALLERPGELVTKEDLIARAWPNTFVGPANLAVQIGGLRRALGDGVGQTRYLINIPGRGYRFVAQVRVETGLAAEPALAAASREHALPAHVLRPVGPSDSIEGLAEKLQHQGLLTIVGAGGGKSPVTLAVVEPVGRDRNGLWLLDLRSLGQS